MELVKVSLVFAVIYFHQGSCRVSFQFYDDRGLHIHTSSAYPKVLRDGFLDDTIEVAVAKKAHLAALASHNLYDSHQLEQQNTINSHHHPSSYHGPIAIPVVLPNGFLADTPEVAMEKSHHLSAVAQAKANKYYSGHSEHGYAGAYGYSGSHYGYGIPVVLPNRHIADTKEVAAAKSAHLLAVAKAKADSYYGGYGQNNGYGGSYGYSRSYHGYGIPVVLPSGYLADTPEVASAKTAHMAAVAQAKVEQVHSGYSTHLHEDVSDYEPVAVFNQEVSHAPHYQPGYVLQLGSHPTELQSSEHESSSRVVSNINDQQIYLVQAVPVLFAPHQL